jgi:hypothetical protein
MLLPCFLLFFAVVSNAQRLSAKEQFLSLFTKRDAGFTVHPTCTGGTKTKVDQAIVDVITLAEAALKQATLIFDEADGNAVNDGASANAAPQVQALMVKLFNPTGLAGEDGPDQGDDLNILKGFQSDDWNGPTTIYCGEDFLKTTGFADDARCDREDDPPL